MIVEQVHEFRDLAIVIAVVVAIAIASLLVTPLLVRRGLKTPAGMRLLNQLSMNAIGVLRRPITVMVLDEVIAVIKTGTYTRNISDAIVENHDELKAMAAEKIRDNAGISVLGRIPGYERIVGQASESVIQVLIAMLADPRMDEFVSDLLRNNLEQIQNAVHRREYEHTAAFRPAGVPTGGRKV